MSKRKALSAEEKRQKLQELFHESGEVFQLKDLERIAPAEKGIVLQSVKSTLQELVDNGEVRSEKIGGSTYYWAFPSDAVKKVKVQIEANETQSAQITQKIESVQQKLKSAESNSVNVVHADILSKEIDALKKEKEQLEKKLTSLSSNNHVNYEVVASKQQDAQKIMEAANRWTDNIFAVKSWCKRKFYKEEQEMNKAFGIPDDLDYIET